MQTWPADRVERKPIADLVLAEANARTHSDAQVEEIAKSMTEWGWTNPVLVDESFTVIAGHGRLLAAQTLGITEAPVMVADGWTDAQCRAYAIADNQLAMNAGWDNDILKMELKGLADWGFDVGLLGFDNLDELISGAKFDGGFTNQEQYEDRHLLLID